MEETWDTGLFLSTTCDDSLPIKVRESLATAGHPDSAAEMWICLCSHFARRSFSYGLLGNALRRPAYFGYPMVSAFFIPRTGCVLVFQKGNCNSGVKESPLAKTALMQRSSNAHEHIRWQGTGVCGCYYINKIK